MAIQKLSCHDGKRFTHLLQDLHHRGYVNVRHHRPEALKPNEYLICTELGCRRCVNRSGLCVLWREHGALGASDASAT